MDKNERIEAIDEEIDMVLQTTNIDLSLDFEPEEDVVKADNEKDEVEIIFESNKYNIHSLCQEMKKIDLCQSYSRKILHCTNISTQKMIGRITPNLENAEKTVSNRRARKLHPSLQLLKKPFFIRSFPSEPFPNRPNWNRNKISMPKFAKHARYVKTDPLKPPTIDLKEFQEIEPKINRKISDDNNKSRRRLMKNDKHHICRTSLRSRKKKSLYKHSLGDSKSKPFSILNTSVTSYSTCVSINCNSTYESIGKMSRHARKAKLVQKRKFQRNIDVIANHIADNACKQKDVFVMHSKVCNEKIKGSFTTDEAHLIFRDVHNVSKRKLHVSNNSDNETRKVVEYARS